MSSPTRASSLRLLPVLPFTSHDFSLASSPTTAGPSCAVLPPTPPLTPLPLARASPKCGEFEFRLSQHQRHSLSPPAAAQPATALDQSTSSSLASNQSVWSVHSWLSTSSSYFPAEEVMSPAVGLLLRAATLILIVVGWIVVANAAAIQAGKSTTTTTDSSSDGSGSDAGAAKTKFALLPWCSALFAVLFAVNVFYIRRSLARVYLPFRRAHLSTMPHLQRQLDPRWTDGTTLLYRPKGFAKVFEWSLGLRPEVVLPVAPVPAVPAYEAGIVIGGLDESTVYFMTERATREGVAPNCESRLSRRLSRSTPADAFATRLSQTHAPPPTNCSPAGRPSVGGAPPSPPPPLALCTCPLRPCPLRPCRPTAAGVGPDPPPPCRTSACGWPKIARPLSRRPARPTAPCSGWACTSRSGRGVTGVMAALTARVRTCCCRRGMWRPRRRRPYASRTERGLRFRLVSPCGCWISTPLAF